MAHLTRKQVDDLVERRVTLRRKFDDGHVRELVQESLSRQIPVASHDDDTPAKVAWVHDMGVSISERKPAADVREVYSIGANRWLTTSRTAAFRSPCLG